jgi:hypothetical protein
MSDEKRAAEAAPSRSLRLLCHPATPAAPIRSFGVSLQRQPGHRLRLCYRLDMAVEQLTWPDPAEPDRTDNLWQSTCCELFLRRPGADAYAECNFSPSSQWAAYRFDDVRTGMALLEMAPPHIALESGERHVALEAIVALPPEWQDGALEIALSAVIETTGPVKSYWALAHPADRPDFHHPGSFTLRLPTP